MLGKEPIEWVRELMRNKTEQEIIQAEQNVREIINYFCTLSFEELNMVETALTQSQKESNLKE